MPIQQGNFIRMNEDDSPIFIGSVSKNGGTANVDFSAAELDALNAREGDLIITLFFFNNRGYFGSNDNPLLSASLRGGQTWTLYEDDILEDGDTNPVTGAKMYRARYNGSWSTTLRWVSGDATVDAPIVVVLAYRMSDSSKSFSLHVPDPSGGSGTAGQNVYQDTAGTDITLTRYSTGTANRRSYLYFLLIMGGSTTSTTAITLNIVTNTGWVQDAQFTRANSGYTIARIYTWKTNKLESSTTMPQFVFDRTNGSRHGLFSCVFFTDL